MRHNMPPTVFRCTIRFALTGTAVMTAFLLRELALRFGVELSPFLVLFPAVAVAAWLGGLWHGLAATALSAALADLWIFPSTAQWGIVRVSEAISLAAFSATGLLLSIAFERTQRQRRMVRIESEQRLRATQAQLRASEAMYRSLAESVPAMVWAADGQGMRIHENRRWYEYTGQTHEQALGLGWRSVIHAEDLGRVLDCWDRSSRTGEDYEIEYRIRGVDRVYRWHRVHARLKKDDDGTPQRWFGTSINIEDRKQAEDALRRSEAKYRLLAESISEPFYAMDGDLRVTFWNSQVAELTGIPEEAALGRTRLELFGKSAGQARADAYCRQCLLTQQPVSFEIECTFRGVRRCFDARVFPYEGGVATIGSDITERKLVENRLRRFYETDLFAILYWRIDGGIVEVNDRFLKMTGYSREEVRSGRIDWTKITPPEYRSKDENARRQIRETGIHQAYEKEFVRKDGTRVWGEFWGAAYEDDMTQGVSFILDITERKRAEAELRQQAELLDLAHDTIMVCGLDGAIRFWNHGAEEMYEYTRQEVVGKIARALLQTVSPQPMNEIMQQVVESGRWEGELAHTTKSGKGIVVASRWVLQRDGCGNPCGIMEIDTDITERTRSDEAQRQAHQKLQSVLDSITDGMLTLDRRWCFTYLNERGAALLGSVPKNLVGRSFWELFPHAAETRLGETFRNAVRTQAPAHFEVFYAEPLNRWLECHCYPSSDELSVYFRDISERKKSEQALLNSEKLASVGRMAATIAHEINNPLAAVTNLLFLARLMDALPEAARQYIDSADAELKRIAHLVRQSLGFYRESNAPVTVSLSAVLDSAQDLLKHKIREKHAKIVREDREPVNVIANAGELRQVFSNLLANGLDAIDDQGAIRLRVAMHADPSTEDRCARVTFADNGKGIDAACRQHIFEPFFTTKGTVGTGLGLWVSKQIIDKHHGAIRIRSGTDPGHRGSVFCVILPIAHPHTETHREATALDAPEP